ncbi:MAG: glycosyltransferase, partial [Planctomycetaceae bacterium]|nr:glycosyltransferase [Planctomycetaceae bacterium]
MEKTDSDSAHPAFTVSVVIPVLNEEATVAQAVASAAAAGAAEIIVVDGGSTDRSVLQAREAGATVISSSRGRGLQQNAGAAMATG